MTAPGGVAGDGVIFETPRLVVAPWTCGEADLARLFDIYSRWEVTKWLGSVPTPLESLDRAAAVVDRWAARGDAQRGLGVWAVRVRTTGQIAGTVLLVELPASGGSGASGDIEVGWHLHPDSWGHGYATEAAAAALERGFAHGFPAIHAVVRPGNAPSVAVCHRLGMTPLGLTYRWYDTTLEAFRKTPDRRPPSPPRRS